MSTRQYIYQLKHLATGLCTKCSKPLKTAWHCEAHAVKHATKARMTRAKIRALKAEIRPLITPVKQGDITYDERG